MAPETEKGFGSGLRRQIERKQNPEQPVVEVVADGSVDEFFVEPLLHAFDQTERSHLQAVPAEEDVAPAPVAAVPDLGPELEAARVELAAALE